MQHQRPTSKIGHACQLCRSRKVKCGGGTPCENCNKHQSECYYPPSQRKRLRGYSHGLADHSSPVMRQPIPHSYQTSTSTPPSHVLPNNLVERQHITSPVQAHARTSLSAELGSSSNQSGWDGHQINPADTQHVVESNSRDSLQNWPDPLKCSFLPESHRGNIASKAADALIDKEAPTIPPQKVNWEHHGPGSWLSICSQPGTRWVAERVGNAEFNRSAKVLTLGWSQRLKLMSPRNKSEEPEPDEQTACKYCTAYFEHSYDALGGVIYRAEFEARLRAHFDSNLPVEDDVAWYALRNTVYAAGARTYLFESKQMKYVEAQAKAWRFYENALSVFIELVFAPSAIPAVQALAAMTFYVEAIGNPALQYMMCATAARLAYAKGLHRQPAKSWNLAASEVLQRNWLFWAIYCCEKHITYRCGRPSAVDDDDISCQIPTSLAQGDSLEVQLLTHKIKLAQISSQISRRLTSVKALQRTTEEITQAVAELTKELEGWRAGLPASVRPGAGHGASNVDSTDRFLFSQFFDYAFNGSLAAIHQVFAYPWIAELIGNEKTRLVADQIARSTEIVAQAARSMILIAKHVKVQPSTPQWLAFFCPMLGAVNLFITILKDPLAATARADIALLDVAVGHFGNVEIATESQISFPFVREVAGIAYSVVRDAEGIATTGESGNDGAPALAETDPMLTNMDFDPLSELDPFVPGFDHMQFWNPFYVAPLEAIQTDSTLPYYAP